MLRLATCCLLISAAANSAAQAAEHLPGTEPLSREGDLAVQMVAGIDRYLMRELAAAAQHRQKLWQRDRSSMQAYLKSVEPNRQRLRRILGVVDQRLPVTELEYVTNKSDKGVVAETDTYTVHAVRWPVFEGVDADGLLLEPKRKAVACVVALPDADWTPEMLAGLAPGVEKDAQYARRLAENGCRVLVPTLIDRKDTWSGNPRFRMTNQPHREFVYRMAYELGRHVIGYEVQKVLAAVDWFTREKDHPPVRVYGYGEGGLVALCSVAVDTRIQTTVVGGYLGPTQDNWKEPIYRNVWGLFREFGVHGFSWLAVQGKILYEYRPGPVLTGPPPARAGRSGAAPGRLEPYTTRNLLSFAREQEALDNTMSPSEQAACRVNDNAHFIVGEGKSAGAAAEYVVRLLMSSDKENLRPADKESLRPAGVQPVDARKDFDPASRQLRQFDQLCAYTQRLMREAEIRRKEFWSKADPSSLEKWQESCKSYRAYFWEEVIGKLPKPSEPMNPRSRLTYDTPKWKGFEVTLDLYPDVFAYGILLIPKDLKPGERRPVVVCQHGLEGRPQDVVNPNVKTPYYNSFGAQLADRGYIVYAPQNPYFGQDKFRVLQRKANPLKLSLFSFIVRQHERTLDWLAELPFVDSERIAFYGLSYGGKTAMRVPALLERYCLSICSGDFNEWIWKNVSTDFVASYMFTGEYEMYEFDLGNTFNYSEMAALIAPRPFMVERGHDDGVGIDEWVSYEYAKVRRLYSKLGIANRTEIEFFPGGHMINGKRTFEFLEEHLKKK